MQCCEKAVLLKEVVSRARLLQGLEAFSHPVSHRKIASLMITELFYSDIDVLQPHYLKDNKLIAYSLGNFLFHPKQMMGGNNPVRFLTANNN